ncbi:exodeoxyribonuclease VII large subunit [Candidimonas humi]|uniref:Exodeoxyribonuclease 7 large subunit n=1 Tax=Candidimonas humi TaxID=683355 RepID=A0ABV8NUE0_9BURK|nr:exodeoxyribonuclease VII large subunit [Candidimonas humi]MBV6305968.1 exodeoxyribonuclease VII large subunit [Candidimonas humi]
MYQDKEDGAASRESAAGSEVLSVSELNRRVGRLLETQVPTVWVRGEVSNFTQAASGHWYFTIKDERAAVRAVMFRGRAQAVGFVPRVGERFEFRAAVTLYEARGDYQLQVEALRRAGQGNLHEAFMALKEKLAAEGLFDPERKRPCVPMPAAVGIVTSLAAAALHDVLTTMRRRAPHVHVIVYPAPVQGADAAGRLCQALALAYERAEVDTLLLVRGGGSIEDLWSFNDEALARMIASSPVPVISGVGHETDFTIADFAADLRAPTPTAAAELCCRARSECLRSIETALGALQNQQRRLLERAALRLDRAVAMLVPPAQRLARQRDVLHGLCDRLQRAGAAAAQQRRARLDALRARLLQATPDPARARLELLRHRQQLARAAERVLALRRARLDAAAQMLEALSPRKILGRGYALVRDASGALVYDARALQPGDRLALELAQGGAQVSVLQAHGLL